MSLFQEFLFWHLKEYPKEILRVWKNFVKFGVFFFSAKEILKTLFSPYKRVVFEKPRGFHPWVFFESLTGNLISRIIGFFVRSIFLLFFLIYEIFIIFFGIIFCFFLIFWLPIFLIYGISRII